MPLSIFYLIPLTGLPETLHSLIFFLLILPGLSILTVLLFPRIFTSLFLKIKRKVFYKYKDAYIETDTIILSRKKYLKRVIYCALLVFGLMSFIMPRIDETLFLDSIAIQNFENLGIPPYFANVIFFSLVGILTPIAVGILSIGWAIEDAGLMHYKIPSNHKNLKLFEIEPIHIKYNSYIKGFANITSILFAIEMVSAFGPVISDLSKFADLFQIIMFPVNLLVILLPIYYIYSKKGCNITSLRKNLKPIKSLNESEIFK